MSKIYYQTLSVTGTANETVYSSVFTSTQAQQKYVLGVYLYVTATDGNFILATQDREEVLNVIDYLVGTNTNPQQTFWPLNFQLPIGSEFKLGVQSGGTANVLHAVIAYTQAE